MTREEFQNKRTEAVINALNQELSIIPTGRNRIANHKRRITTLTTLKEKIENGEFWTPELEYYYQSLYSKVGSDYPVSAY